jgi:hypothetical protein
MQPRKSTYIWERYFLRDQEILDQTTVLELVDFRGYGGYFSGS